MTQKAVKRVALDALAKNREIVLRVLHSGNTFTLSDLSSSVGLSRQTVKKAIDYFIEKDLVSEIGKGESTDLGGKRPMLYKFDSGQKLLCILISASSATIIVTDLQANIIDDIIISDIISLSYEELIGQISSSCDTLYKRNLDLEKQICGVSCCVPGIIEKESGILRYNIFMGNWGYDLPLKKDLENKFPDVKYVFVDNIGKIIGRSLMWDFKDEVENERVMLLYTSVGISACVLEYGRVLNGANSLIGEIGHMTLDYMDGELCLCGSKGCFEVLTSIDRVKSRVRELLGQYPDSILAHKNIDELTFRDIFDGSKSGDALCRAINESLAKWFGLAFRTIALTIDPSAIRIIGNFSYADDFFKENLIEEMNKFRYYPRNDKCSISYDTRDTFDMEIKGCAQSIVEQYLSNIDLYLG